MASANGISDCKNDSLEFAGFSQLFRGIAELPVVVKLLETQAQEIKEMKHELAELIRCSRDTNGQRVVRCKSGGSVLGHVSQYVR